MKFDSTLKILAMVGASISFTWGAYQWRENFNLHREELKIAAQKALRDQQLVICTDATKAASQIVTQGDKDIGKAALYRFEALDAGEFSFIKDPEVQKAREQMMKGLKNRSSIDELKKSSQALDVACGELMAKP